MKEKLKTLILVNSISLIMFIFCLILILKTGNIIVGMASSMIWLVYTIISNIYVFSNNEKESLRDTFHKTNKGLFNREVSILQKQYDSIKSREDFMKNSTESMQDLYYKILEQAESNLESAMAYMDSYDYYTKPEPTYLHNLINDGNTLVQKFNALVEKLVDIDTNPTELDTNYIDDLTSSLDQMKQYQKIMMS